MSTEKYAQTVKNLFVAISRGDRDSLLTLSTEKPFRLCHYRPGRQADEHPGVNCRAGAGAGGAGAGRSEERVRAGAAPALAAFFVVYDE